MAFLRTEYVHFVGRIGFHQLKDRYDRLPPPVRISLAATTVFLASLFGATLGFRFSIRPDHIGPVWPPIAVLVSVLLLTPPRRWWIYLCVAVPAELAADLSASIPWQMALAFVGADFIEALIAGVLLRRLFGGAPPFEALRQTVRYLGVGVLFAPFVGAVAGAWILMIGQTSPRGWSAWHPWFMRDALTHLALTPAILSWLAGEREEEAFWPIRRYLEVGILLIIFLGAGLYAFGHPANHLQDVLWLFSAPWMLLGWAAIRFIPRVTFSASLFVTLVAIWRTAQGRGPFVVSSAANTVLSLQMFLGLAVTSIVLLATSVEERRQEDKRLRERKERLGILFESAPDAFYLTDLTGTIVDGNRAAQELIGYAREELIGRNFLALNLLHPSEMVGVEAFLARSAAGAPTGPDEFSLRRKDGSQVPVEIRMFPANISGQTLVLAIARDITEPKRAKEALAARIRQLERVRRVNKEVTRELDLTVLLRLITRRATELVGSAGGTVRLWDEASQRLVSATWHGVAEWLTDGLVDLGEKVARTVAQRREGMIVNDFRTSPSTTPLRLEGTGPPAVLAEPLLNRDELIGVIVLTAEEPGRPFTSEDSEILRLFAAHAAIAIENARLYADLKQAYEDLQRAREERVQSEKLQALSQMAAGIAHNLNNVLAIVLGQVELLQVQVDEPEVQRRLSILRTAATDGVHVIRRLQGFTRQRPSGSLIPCNLTALVQEAVELTRPRWQNVPRWRGVVIEVRTVLEAHPPIIGHPAEIREALTNLIFNAVDAMPEGGLLTLAEHATPEGVALTVSDTGVGMTDEVRQHVFEPYFTTKEGRGTGLGLSIVYGIMQRHGGRIEVTSTPDKGTTFTLWFRVAWPREGRMPRRNEPVYPPNHDGKPIEP
jgi:PAS domain S-box-containing protein